MHISLAIHRNVRNWRQVSVRDLTRTKFLLYWFLFSFGDLHFHSRVKYSLQISILPLIFTSISRSGKTRSGDQEFNLLLYEKCGDVHEKFDFLENARFKTLEHFLKTVWNTLAEFTSTWNLRKVHSGISFFYVATAIATAVNSKNMTKNTYYFKHILTILCNKAVKRCPTRLI